MAAGDLTTVDNVRLFLDIKTNADDALLTRLVSAASQFMQQYLSRQLLSAAATERYDGHGGIAQVLRRWPITAVASVKVDGVAVPAAPSYSVNGYMFDDISIVLHGYSFTRGRANVEIAYTAGYATVPADLVQVCNELVALRFRERSRIGETSRGLAGSQTNYLTKDMTDNMRSVLANYQRKVPV